MNQNYFTEFSIRMNQKLVEHLIFNLKSLNPKPVLPNLIATTFSGRVHPFDHCWPKEGRTRKSNTIMFTVYNQELLDPCITSTVLNLTKPITLGSQCYRARSDNFRDLFSGRTCYRVVSSSGKISLKRAKKGPIMNYILRSSLARPDYKYGKMYSLLGRSLVNKM